MSDQESHAVVSSHLATGDSLNIDGDAVGKLAKLGASASGAEIVQLDLSTEGLPPTIPVVVVHGDAPKIVSIKALAEEWRERPQRRLGTAHVGDVSSFCDLLNRHKTDDSVVFARSDWRSPALTAVVDYHAAERVDAGDADFGRHRIHYAFPFSDEWKTWLEHDGAAMTQHDFAEFMEERMPDLVALVPAEAAHFERELQVASIGVPAQIFELARGLEVNVGGKVRQNIKLQSGEAKITFEEEHTGKDGAPLTVPGAFALSVPLFYNEEPITIPVRLRYRVSAGGIVWIYKLFRVDRIVAEAVRQAKAEVATRTGLPVYEGAAEMNAAGVPVGA